MDNLKKLMRLYRLYARMDLNWFLQDTAGCLLVVFSELVTSVSAISGVALLAVRFSGVGGLAADEVLWMLGFFTLAEGLTNMMLGSNNVLHISRRVGRGQLDHMLIQPCPLIVQLLAEGFMPVSGSSGFVTGLVLTCVATARLGIAVTPGWIALFAGYLLSRMGVMAGQSYLLGAAAFYRPAACEEISSIAVDLNGQLGRYPLIGLPRALAGALTTAFPVALMAYYPSMILLGKMNKDARAALPFAVAAAFLVLAGICFQKGLKYYVQYGCNRYRDLGHRG